jgi:superkiller protein 3
VTSPRAASCATLVTLLALLTLPGPLASCGSVPRGPGAVVAPLPKAKPEARPHFEEGVRLLGRGGKQLEAALAAFEKATDIDPKLYEAWHDKGVTHARLGRWDPAIEAFGRALDLNPSSRPTALALAEAYGRVGRGRDAETLLARWSAARPDDVELSLLRGQALRSGGKHAEALELLRGLLARDSRNGRVFAALGLVYHAMGKPGLAESSLRRAIDLAPAAGKGKPREAAEAWNNLGLVLLDGGKDQEAFAAFEKASELDDGFAASRLNKASVFLDCGDYKRAADELDRAAKIAPDDPEVHVALGVAARGQKRFEKAREEYERALEIVPDHPAALFNLGVLFLDFINDKKKAASYLILYRKVAPASDPRARAKSDEALARLKEIQ